MVYNYIVYDMANSMCRIEGISIRIEVKVEQRSLMDTLDLYRLQPNL